MAKLGQEEMRVGIRSDAFGNVQVRTVVHESQVGLAVGSERGDLRSFLASEIPALESHLRQHDLRFEQIHFLGSGTPAGDAYAGGGPQSQSFAQGRFVSHRIRGPGEEEAVGSGPELPAEPRTGLNILV